LFLIESDQDRAVEVAVTMSRDAVCGFCCESQGCHNYHMTIIPTVIWGFKSPIAIRKYAKSNDLKSYMSHAYTSIIDDKVSVRITGIFAPLDTGTSKCMLSHCAKPRP